MIHTFVGQETIVQVPLREGRRRLQGFRREFHAVVPLVVGPHGVQNVQRLLDGRLPDQHGLQPSLQRGVLFNVLPVLGDGRGAHDLDLAARQGGFQLVRRVEAALGAARPDEVVDLVKEQDGGRGPLVGDLLQDGLQALLEFACVRVRVRVRVWRYFERKKGSERVIVSSSAMTAI